MRSFIRRGIHHTVEMVDIFSVQIIEINRSDLSMFILIDSPKP